MLANAIEQPKLGADQAQSVVCFSDRTLSASPHHCQLSLLRSLFDSWQRYISARWHGRWDSLARGELVRPHNCTCRRAQSLPRTCTRSRTFRLTSRPTRALNSLRTNTRTIRSEWIEGHDVQACAPFARCYGLVVSLIQVCANSNLRVHRGAISLAAVRSTCYPARGGLWPHRAAVEPRVLPLTDREHSEDRARSPLDRRT